MDHGAENYARFLSGDEDGFVAIVKAYKDGLLLYINSYVHDIYAAEELTEDTFVKLGIKKPKYKGQAAFKTWLYAIARNLAIDYLRKHAKHREQSLEGYREIGDERNEAEGLYLQETRKRLLYQAMDQLKPIYQQVLWLLYFEEFSHKEIAKILKKSVHNVETIAYRARLSLRAVLEKEAFSDEDI